MPELSWLLSRLQNAYDDEITNRIWRGYGAARPVTFRVNSIKTNKSAVKTFLSENGFVFSETAWYDDAIVLENAREEDIVQTEIYRRGEIYLQSLSSMLPPLFLKPQENEIILDMTAAPGGKTTQISALSNGRAFITACEQDRVRAERLSYNIKKQGAPRVTQMTADALKLDEYFRFDKILLDAPCSGSGTLSLNRQIFISEKLVENSATLQKKLICKALKLLKKGGTLVYSTCSVLPSENEAIIENALKTGQAELVPLEIPTEIPRIPSKEGTLCVCPDRLFEGFFVAKLKKC